VPGKGHIFDVVDPHDCEGYAIKANEEEKPTVLDVLENLKSLGKTIEDSARRSEDANLVIGLKDERSDVKTSAPQGLLRSMRDLPSSNEDFEE
jgi:hypothetical protein